METNNETKQEILDKRYMRMAMIWAENSYCNRRKVGALIVKNKMIISDGYNGTPDLKTYARTNTESPSRTFFTLKPMPSPK